MEESNSNNHMANNVARAIVAALDWNSTPGARKDAVSFLESVWDASEERQWTSHHIDPALIPPSDVPFTYSKEPIQTWSGPLVDPAGAGGPRRNKKNTGDTREPSKLPTGKDKSRDTRLKGKKSMASKLQCIHGTPDL